MARTNEKRKGTDHRMEPEVRVAGGMGAPAARQDAAAQLRRAVMANLLWEDAFYESGQSIAKRIAELVPQVDATVVAEIAIEARHEQQLRHVPLLLARELARNPASRHVLGSLLPVIIRRPDELGEFLSLYWQDQPDAPLASQVKKGLAMALTNFDEYQLAKWDREAAIRIRDVLFLTHARPWGGVGNTRRDRQAGRYDPTPGGQLFRRLAEDQLATPDTWEVALSGGADKRDTWERLIRERKIPALAFVRNLRNMEEVGVDPAVIRQGFAQVSARWLLPINMLIAARQAPRWERELEGLMLRTLERAPQLPGHTVLVVDVSGSMAGAISDKSQLNRIDAAAALAMLANEVCESVSIYATAGRDPSGTFTGAHQTERLRPRRGFALVDDIQDARRRLGGGGIFVRQCLEYIRSQERETPARIMVFSDSQDTDRVLAAPRPFGQHNYIIDVSSHTRGVAYQGVWTAEIAGWSPHFLTYVAALEGVSLQQSADE